MSTREISDELGEELFAPGFRMENAATAVTDRTYTGTEGVPAWITDMFEADDTTRIDVEEVLRHGESFVVNDMSSLDTALAREHRSRSAG